MFNVFSVLLVTRIVFYRNWGKKAKGMERSKKALCSGITLFSLISTVLLVPHHSLKHLSFP